MKALFFVSALKRVKPFADTGKNGMIHLQTRGTRLIVGATDASKALITFVPRPETLTEDIDMFIEAKHCKTITAWIESLDVKDDLEISNHGDGIVLRMPNVNTTAELRFAPYKTTNYQPKPWQLFPTRWDSPTTSMPLALSPKTVQSLKMGLQKDAVVYASAPDEDGKVLFSSEPGLELGVVTREWNARNIPSFEKILNVWSDVMEEK